MSYFTFGKKTHKKLLESLALASKSVERLFISSDQSCDLDKAFSFTAMLENDRPLQLGINFLKQELAKRSLSPSEVATAIALSYALLRESLLLATSGMDIRLIEQSLVSTHTNLLKNLKELSSPIEDDYQLLQIASIATDGNIHAGEVICRSLQKMGPSGAISMIESSYVTKAQESLVEGLSFPIGVASPYFFKGSLPIHLQNAAVLIIDIDIVTPQQILPLLSNLSFVKAPLLFIFKKISPAALSTLIMNHLQGLFSSCVIEIEQKENLNDIAALTGAHPLSHIDKTISPERLSLAFGKIQSATIGKSETVLIEGYGDSAELHKHIEVLKKSAFDQQSQATLRRALNLQRGIYRIEIPFGEKSFWETAFTLTRSALQDGFLAGGNASLIELTRQLQAIPLSNLSVGEAIYANALCTPLQMLIEQTGLNRTSVLQELIASGYPYTFDSEQKVIYDALKAGQLTPYRKVANVLQCASDITLSFLQTYTLVVGD